MSPVASDNADYTDDIVCVVKNLTLKVREFIDKNAYGTGLTRCSINMFRLRYVSENKNIMFACFAAVCFVLYGLQEVYLV